ncbi:hypothetical protein CDD82_4540 [Ophiocordyceps australis]|uniref:Uncharacterized protein n=1 Tax=Ophiocordyceps australis TaxID=1399860 RepID=A0A2C5XK56_9HYPO|nr:hypothetical protein CDD82_4540 [Ophiocordyceps australis]
MTEQPAPSQPLVPWSLLLPNEPLSKRLKRAFTFAPEPFDVENRFVTSWIVAPFTLAAIRMTIGSYILSSILFIIAWSCTHPATTGGCVASRRSFSYFTVLAFWGQAFYFIVAAIHTFFHASCPGHLSLLSRFRRPFGALHSFFYSSVVVFPLLVSMIYWAMIFKGPWRGSTFDSWRNVSQHALNSVFALFEMTLTRTLLLPVVHLLWLFCIIVAYLGVAFLTNADQDFFVYAFLDKDQVGGAGLVTAYIACVAMALVVLFVVAQVIIRVRLWGVEDRKNVLGEAVTTSTQSSPEAELRAINPDNNKAPEKKQCFPPTPLAAY